MSNKQKKPDPTQGMMRAMAAMATTRIVYPPPISGWGGGMFVGITGKKEEGMSEVVFNKKQFPECLHVVFSNEEHIKAYLDKKEAVEDITEQASLEHFIGTYELRSVTKVSQQVSESEVPVDSCVLQVDVESCLDDGDNED